MNLSKQGLEFIKSWEKFRPTPYDDNGKEPGGYMTIGYGHVIQKAEKFPRPITEAQALNILYTDVADAVRWVNRGVKVAVKQNQFDALVSLAYNIGSGAFIRSTLLLRLNMRDFNRAAAEFLVWRKSSGQVMAGLERRRAAEREMFLNGSYTV